MSQPLNQPTPTRAPEADARARMVKEPTPERSRSVAPSLPTSTSSKPPVGENEPGAVATTDKPARSVATMKPKRVRKARLRLARIDPWSVMKTSLLFSIAGGIMFWVATYLVWSAIGSSGLFEALNKMVSGIVNTPGDENQFQIENYISTNKVLGLAALLAAVDVVILTALATLGSFLYNLAATMLGGIEVTLAED